MEYSKTKSKALYGWKGKMLLALCCLSMLLTSVFAAVTDPGTVHAGGFTVTAVSPLEQQLKLSQPSSIVPGGRGYMTPQQVVVKDPAGRPVSNVPVTFEATNTNYITAVMRGSNKNTITVITDANGIASAANTDSYAYGEGFQVYSTMPALMQTLQVKASVPEMNTVTFNVKVATVGYGK